MARGQTTVINKVNKQGSAFKTVVPSSVIHQFDVGDGDELRWIFEADGDKLCLRVEPVKHKKVGKK